MLRKSIQGAGRHRHRFHWKQLSSLAAPTSDPRSEDGDTAGGDDARETRRRPPSSWSSTAAAPPTSRRRPDPFARRCFSISRHPDPLRRHGTINVLEDDGDGDVVGGDGAKDDSDGGKGSENAMSQKMNEAGDFWGEGGGGESDYSDIFGGGGTGTGDDNDNDDDERDEEAGADAAFHARQEKIREELDSRTGRLWTDEWIISDEEWTSNIAWEDVEEWKPIMATRKSLESVRVFEGGVPTLEEMAGLALPDALPPHPGHGVPATHAKFRKRQIKKKLQTAIQLAIHDDLKKILAMGSWEEKQEGVDGLFEVVEGRVREREPVLGKLPEFGNMVEKGLEDVLGMVQGRMRGAQKAEKAKKKMMDHDKEISATEEKESGNAGNAQEGDGGPSEGSSGSQGEAAPNESKNAKENVEETIDVMGVNAAPPTPIFMDILAAANRQQQQEEQQPDGDGVTADAMPPALPAFFAESNDASVPNLVYPLDVHRNDGVGRMVEEWQLAANKATKRIMMRDATREIASKVVDAMANGRDDDDASGEGGDTPGGAARVFVTGGRGVGKTTTLAGIVASARLSGHIVIYLPEGDRLRKHGFYVEPCQHRGGLYNLPEIGKEFCEQLLTSHGDDLASMPAATREDMGEHLSEDQIKRLFRRAYKEDESVAEEDVASMTELSLDQLLAVGIESASLSSGCYSTVISILMNQTQKPFTVVMDEFNCYYDHGLYFHGEYDDNVRKGVPLNRITIFKPFMDAMGLYPEEAGTEISNNEAGDDGGTAAPPSPDDAMMKWGSVIVATSESRAVRRSFTQSLTDAAIAQQLLSSPSRRGDDVDADGKPQQQQRHPLHVVDIQRFSNIEVQHILYNYEITGVGRLRFDRGDTALNPEEVEYLRLVSGGSGQQLMDSCMMRH